MLTHINDRLNEWALWKGGARFVGRGAGISPFPAYNKLGGSGGGRGSAPPPHVNYIPVDDLRCVEIDRCVCAVGFVRPALKQAIEEFYCRLGSTEYAAQRCKCSRMTLHRRIDDAHNIILGYLNDIAAGVALPGPQPEVPVTPPIETAPLRKRTSRLTCVIQKPYISGTLV